ncbi:MULTISPECIES: hypothetical protein [unclassified Beijerinckia]|uniref:hypothetical protein n=1 Tax=unclassified Beijerinckia TaxID=2638183 RepID=UPI001AECAC8A|nr:MULTISPECIES: hypothetical protein [unclassified Beijerinckia]MDH7795323.1 hypothetical protein [Beijerinckia sp. GAS462]
MSVKDRHRTVRDGSAAILLAHFIVASNEPTGAKRIEHQHRSPHPTYRTKSNRMRVARVTTVSSIRAEYASRGCSRRNSMSKDTHEHHTKAAEHHELAAKHHREAAKHHESGEHEKAAHHSKIAHGHSLHATEHHEHASKKHAEHHS